MSDRSKRRSATILAGLLFTLFLAALDFSLLTTAIPSIAFSLNSQTVYVWIGSAYLLTSAAVAPVWGKASDIWGRKSTLLSSIAVFFVGSIVCAASRSVADLIAGRAVQGFGAGGLIVLVNVCISDLWSVRRRGLFLGMTGLVWGLASGIGPLLGGAFAQYVTWRWAFWINLPCCFCAFIVLAIFLDLTERRASLESSFKSMDWIGSISIVGVTVMVLLSLDFGGVVSPWNSPKTLGLLIGGLTLLGTFILWEAKGAAEPMMPLRLMKYRSNVAPLLVCFTHGFVNVSSWYFLPLYFQAVLEASPTRSGVLILPIILVQACVGVGAGALIHRFGRYCELIWAGMCLMTLGFGLFVKLGASTSMTAIILFEIIAGIGVGSVFQAPLIAYQSSIISGDLAAATALFGFVRSFSTSISVIIGGVVFQNGMANQAEYLEENLNRTTAQKFSASSAASNILMVHTLPPHQKAVVKQAYVASLRNMWILYASVAALGLLISIFVRHQPLDDDVRASGSRGIESDISTGVELQRK